MIHAARAHGMKVMLGSMVRVGSGRCVAVRVGSGSVAVRVGSARG